MTENPMILPDPHQPPKGEPPDDNEDERIQHRLDARDRWLEQRRNSVGGSEAASVLGINPFQTPLQLYLRKAGLAPEQVDEPEWLRVGHAMETAIDTLYRDETGRDTYNPGEYAIVRHDDYPDMHVTLDRVILPRLLAVTPSVTEIRPAQKITHPGVLQLKWVGPYMVKHWDDGIPLYVQVQIQQEMFVSQRTWGSAAALLGGYSFVWSDMDINVAFCAELARRCSEFMACVREGRPPEAGADDTDALRTLYPKHEPGKTKELPADLMEVDEELEAATLDMIRARRRVRKCGNRIKAAMGTAEVGVLPNGKTYVYRATQRKGFTTRPSTIRRLRRPK